MGNVLVEDEIGAPIARVWACFADFGDLGGWAPGAPKVTLDGPASAVGTVRLVENEGQPPIRERLTAYDPSATTFSYAMLESPFPFTDYLATVRLSDLGGGRTGIRWSSSFVPQGMPAESVVALLENVYRMFIGKLKETMAGG
jgi:hypothetical protein